MYSEGMKNEQMAKVLTVVCILFHSDNWTPRAGEGGQSQEIW